MTTLDPVLAKKARELKILAQHHGLTAIPTDSPLLGIILRARSPSPPLQDSELTPNETSGPGSSLTSS